jgi:hypothetical protein
MFYTGPRFSFQHCKKKKEKEKEKKITKLF